MTAQCQQWLMDSECCHDCGCILNDGEWFRCADCYEDQCNREDQDSYDGWFSDWDLPLEEVGKL